MTTTVRADLQNGVPALTGDVLAIRGGRPLRGRVDVKGAKNLATKAMVAALLGEVPSILRDVPTLSDVAVVRSLLEVHGVRVTEGDEPGTLHLDPSDVESAHMEEIDAHAGASRIPILFCGPLLHRLGQAFIPDLGGCRIGDRPIDFHLDALRKFGATVEKLPSGIRLSTPGGRLHGANIHLPYPSVGATEQVLLTAVRAEGTTELRNAAIEPEIMDLIAVLQKMGAIISYEPNRVIVIEGVETLWRLRSPLDLRSQRGGLMGLGGAGDRRRDLRRRGQAAGDADLPQCVPQGRWMVRHPRRRHPVPA